MLGWPHALRRHRRLLRTDLALLLLGSLKFALWGGRRLFCLSVEILKLKRKCLASVKSVKGYRAEQ
jgi:hypothetical protein